MSQQEIEYQILDNNFLNDIKKIINKNYIEHFYLIKNIEIVMNDNIPFQDAWTINKGSNKWIFNFSANGQYHLYGYNWTNNYLKKSIKRIPFEKFTEGFVLSGHQKLVEFAVEKSNIEFSTIKNRFFYKITIGNLKKIETKNIRVASIKDIDELTKMTLDFFKEEYNGKNNKEYENIKIQLIEHILDRTYYVIEIENEIVGFCSLIEERMIGTIFIKNKYRNKKFGTEILNYVTTKILKTNQVCWLMTTQENTSSNKMVEKVGFTKVFNYSSKIVL